MINRIAIYVLCFCGLFSTGSRAQDMLSYQPLKAEGLIPDDFLRSASETYYQQRLPDSSRSLQSALEDFYQEDAYYTLQLLQSGKVLFGDPVSRYISAVGEKIIQHSPELKGQLRFYAVKSPVANAFATNDGIILINIGLLARLKNEAQLAFVLCHEISHFQQKHPLEIFLSLRKQEINGTRLQRREELEDLLLARNNYSQEKELEADRLGLELFLAAGYSLQAAESVFEVLKYAQAPFGQTQIDRNFLANPALPFPENNWLSEKDLVDLSVEIPHNHSTTHPSPGVRQDSIRQLVSGLDSGKRKVWQLSQTTFETVQKQCQYDICRLYILDRSYEAAIYCAYDLVKRYGSNAYLEQVISYGFYAIAKYSNRGQFWDVHPIFDEAPGNWRQILFFMEQLSEEERNILALRYVWQQVKAHPNQPSFMNLCTNLIEELGQFYVDSLDFFKNRAPSGKEVEENPSAFALYDLLAEDAFAKLFSQHLFIGRQKRNGFHNLGSNQPVDQRRQQRIKLKGLSLGLDSVVFVNPFYQRIDKRKETGVLFLESEVEEARFVYRLEHYAQSLNLSYQLLSYRSLMPSETEKFNDLLLLGEWIQEQNQHEDGDWVSFLQQDIYDLQARYGTPYFVWIQGLAVTQPRPGRKIMLLMGLFPPLLPYSLYYVFSPDRSVYFYTIVYDLKKGKYLIYYPKRLKMRDRPDVVHSVLYDLIYQIKSK